MNLTQSPSANERRNEARSLALAIQSSEASSANDASTRLVEEAVVHIQSVLSRTLSRGMMDIGMYILETFYQGNPALVASSNPQKHASLRLLVQRCESISLPVSRTFLSNAIRMAAVSKALPRDAKFLRLPASHRVELLRMRDPERIEQLAVRCLEAGLSVPKLRLVVQQDVARFRLRSGRGRRRKPALIRALDTCVQLLKEGDTDRLAFHRAELAELSLDERVRAKRAYEQLQKRLDELGLLLGH